MELDVHTLDVCPKTLGLLCCRYLGLGDVRRQHSDLMGAMERDVNGRQADREAWEEWEYYSRDSGRAFLRCARGFCGIGLIVN